MKSLLVAVGCRSDGTSDGLQDKRNEVAGDEDDGVPARGDARDAPAVDLRDATEAEVDAGTDEGWGDGGTDEVPVDVLVSLRFSEECLEIYSRKGSKRNGLK